MNTSPHKEFSLGPVAVRALATVAALVALRALAETQDAPKTHTLFMGADVYVGTDKDIYAVKDVVGTSWVVDVNGKERVIPARQGPLNIKITPALKLTEVSATVADLKSERGYTPENDPSTRLAKALGRSEDLYAGNQAALNQANSTVVQAQNVAAYVRGTAGNQPPATAIGSGGRTGNPPPSSLPDPTISAAMASAQVALNSAGSDNELYGDRGLSSGYDAMDVDFVVSSERPLNNPYVVTVTRFHPKGSSAGLVQNLVYAKSLKPIDAHAQSVHLVEGGFPPGFELQDFQIHLYDRGEEIATTVSSKRVPLTREEAFEYVRMEYVSAHKGETLPPTPAMGKLPADLPTLLAGGKYHETYYVRVSRDGLGDELFLDASCTKKVDDPYLQSVVRTLRFKPALERGRPVDGVASLNLGRLAI